jgi:5'-nucleotidase (lipoprotein e(P4) family)
MEGKKLAVVVDLDETMLDNSAYAAWQVANGKGYSKESWERWVASEKATEVPGAAAFANTVVDNGGEIFYISNRSAKQTQSTINNMKALGFPMADNTHVLGKVDSSDKKSRVDSVKAKGFTIVTFAGDNLDDFDSTVHGKLNAERREHVNATKGEYGSKRIVLPNSNYGGFDSGVVKNYSGLDLKEKNQARLEVIRPWNGK